MTDKQGLLNAANALVTDPYAERLYESLMSVAALPRHLPIAIVGEAEMLNPMLQLFRTDKDGFDVLMAKIDAKREARGLAALTAAEPPVRFDKREYQRQFMDQKRQRERRAVEIENLQRPEREQLIGNTRLEFMRQASIRWKVKRDQMIRQYKQAKAVDNLTKDEMQGLLSRFWASVDADLDELEAATMRKIRGL